MSSIVNNSKANLRITGAGLSLVVLVFLIVYSNPVWSAVYKCEDDNGNIIFSDEACKKSQSGTKLRWLKNTHSAKKSKRSKTLTVEQKTARKAKKNNEAYVLLSLLTTTKLELETKTLRSNLDGEVSDRPELMLSDGITVDLLDVDKMLISHKPGADELSLHFIMQDGYEETRIIKKPFPVISGDARLGSFTKSLEDIKQIEFFNSKKLRKKRKQHKNIAAKKSSGTTRHKAGKNKLNKAKKEVPIIELDLSDEVASAPKVKSVKEFGNVSSPVAQPKIKVVPKSTTTPENQELKPVIPSIQGKRLPVVFADDKTTFLERGTLSSRKGDKTAPQGIFVLNNKEQISYTEIKSIRIRPTADKSRLVVAVALKSGEIKMENMSQPFTRIQGRSDKGRFDFSLLDIKSISF